MLQNDLYTIEALTKEEGKANVLVKLNASHPVFTGHFPGQPVLPGACMLQMIKEIMELVTGYPLQLRKANQIKFVSMVDPSIHTQLQLQLTYTSVAPIQVTATLSRDEEVCMKFNGVFEN